MDNWHFGSITTIYKETRLRTSVLFFFHFFHVAILEKFNKILAKLIKFTLEKNQKKIPKISQLLCQKIAKFCQEKKKKTMLRTTQLPAHSYSNSIRRMIDITPH
jgi:hypothetical protein